MDFQKFFGTLRLREFFNSGPTRVFSSPECAENLPNHCDAETANRVQQTFSTKFRSKATFIPPKNRNASIETYSHLVKSDMSKVFHRKGEYKVHDDLTKKEREALGELKKETEI